MHSCTTCLKSGQLYSELSRSKAMKLGSFSMLNSDESVILQDLLPNVVTLSGEHIIIP